MPWASCATSLIDMLQDRPQNKQIQNVLQIDRTFCGHLQKYTITYFYWYCLAIEFLTCSNKIYLHSIYWHYLLSMWYIFIALELNRLPVLCKSLKDHNIYYFSSAYHRNYNYRIIKLGKWLAHSSSQLLIPTICMVSCIMSKTINLL